MDLSIDLIISTLNENYEMSLKLSVDYLLSRNH